MVDKYWYAWFAAFIRPLYLVIFIKVLRTYSIRILYVIKETATIVILIFVYVVYFSQMGQKLFVGTLERTMYFNT